MVPTDTEGPTHVSVAWWFGVALPAVVLVQTLVRFGFGRKILHQYWDEHEQYHRHDNHALSDRIHCGRIQCS